MALISAFRPPPTRSGGWPPRRLPPAIVPLGLFVLGLALRLYGLGARGFWLDESLGAGAVALRGPLDVISWVQADDQMPLPYLLEWAVGHVSSGDAALRLPAALAGALCVPAVYALVRILAGRQSALLAGLLMALWPFAVYYSQEARSYSLFMLAVALQFLAATRIRSGRRRYRDWIALAAACVLALYTQYTGLLTTVAVAVYLLPDLRRGLDPGSALMTGLLVALCYLPWLPALVSVLYWQARAPFLGVTERPAVPDDLRTLLVALGFGGVLAGVLVIGLFRVALEAYRGRRGPAWLIACWAGVPLALLAARMGTGVVLLWPRLLVFALPSLLVAVAVGSDSILRARLRSGAVASAAVAAALALLVVPGLVTSYSIPKDDWRGAAEMLRAGGGTAVVLAAGPASSWVVTGLGRYLPPGGPVALVDTSDTVDDAVRALLARGGARVYVAVYQQDPRAQGGLGDRPDRRLAAELPASAAGIRLARFTGAAFASAPAAGSPVAQAKALLDWASAFAPAAAADAVFLSDPGIQTSAPEVGPVRLTSAGGLAVRTVTLPAGPAPASYVISYSCRIAGAAGRAWLFAGLRDDAGSYVAIHPGGGRDCGPAEGGNHSFVFTSTVSSARTLEISMRAAGPIEAYFESVRLLPLDLPGRKSSAAAPPTTPTSPA